MFKERISNNVTDNSLSEKMDSRKTDDDTYARNKTTRYFDFIDTLNLNPCPLTTREASLIADVMLLSNKPLHHAFKGLLKSVRELLYISEEKNPTCFISYAWANETIYPEEFWTQEFLYHLANWLNQAGIKTSIDKENSRYGNHMQPYMAKSIKTADFIILAGTKALKVKLSSVDSFNVKFEYKFIKKRLELEKQQTIQPGKDTQGTIIPIIISGKDNEALPDQLRGVVAIEDFSGNGLLHSDHTNFIDNFQNLLAKLYSINRSHSNYSNYQKLWDRFRKQHILPKGNCKGNLSINPYLYFQQTKVRQSFFGKNKLRLRDQMPENKGKKYIGREKEFTEIIEKIKNNPNPQRSLLSVISGIGGTGKTGLAKHIIFAIKDFAKSVIWLNVELRTDTHLYHRLIHQLGFDVGNPDSSQQQQLLFDWLRDNPGWVLVLDDVSDYKSIQDFLPPYGGHILITSRSNDWWTSSISIKCYSLSDLTPEENKQLVNDVTQSHKIFEIHQTNKLALRLGYLPLALEQASAYIRENKLSSIDDYISLYEKYPVKICSLYPGHNNVSQTLSLSLNQISKQSPKSIHLLHQCSLFGHALIPKKLLKRLSGMNLYDLNLFLQPSIAYYLIRPDNNDSVSLHPVMADILFDQLKNEEKKEFIENGFVFIKDQLNNKYKLIYQETLIHLMLELTSKMENLRKVQIYTEPNFFANTLMTVLPVLFNQDNMFALSRLEKPWQQLLNNDLLKKDLALYLELLNKYLSYCVKKREGFGFLKEKFQALDINQFSEDARANILLHKGTIEIELGSYAEAIKYFEAAIQTGRLPLQALARAHANRCMAYLQGTKDVVTIQKIEKETFETLHQLPPTDDSITVITYVNANLAEYYVKQGHLEQARTLRLQNIADLKNIKSSNPHRGLSWNYHSLANIECICKNFELAKQYYDFFVEEMNHVFGNLSKWPDSYKKTHDELRGRIDNGISSISLHLKC
jgi:hypothetical protein